MRALILVAVATALAACGPRSEMPHVPIEVLAPRDVELDGETHQARAFTVLESVAIDTGIRPAAGELSFRVRFESTHEVSASIAVQAGERNIGSFRLSEGRWESIAVSVPAGASEPLLLVFETPGRYSLVSLELARSADSGVG